MPVSKRSRKGKQSHVGKQQTAPPPAPPPSAAAAAAAASAAPEAVQAEPPKAQPHQPRSNSSNNNSNNSNNNNINALVLTSDQRRGVFECDYCRNDISQLPRIRCAVCDDFDLCCDCFVASTCTAAGAARQQQHDPRTHGYRVCDSTRYPLFPVKAAVTKNKKAAAAAAAASSAVAASSNTSNNTNNNNNGAVPMDIEGSEGEGNTTITSNKQQQQQPQSFILSTADDPKQLWWTVEEDLRLLKGIETHGLGNWADIAEAVAGPGSSGKTPRRCMERYWDDYLGRYGHVVPPYTLVEVNENEESTEATNTANTNNIINGDEPDSNNNKESEKKEAAASDGTEGEIQPAFAADDKVASEQDGEGQEKTASATQEDTTSPFGTTKEKPESSEAATTAAAASTEEQTPVTASAIAATSSSSTSAGAPESGVRASKRRAAMLRSPSSVSSGGMASSAASAAAAKKYKAVPTETLSEYKQFFPESYLPQFEYCGPVQVGQDVGRDVAVRAEQTYVRAISSLDTKEQVEKVRKDWEKRLNQPGGPTVLPIRPDDIPTLPGSELVGFMPRRGDFDVEWENNAEENIADMEFIPGESEQDRQLKLQVLAIYNSKLDEREKRKDFVLRRKLYDYRQHQQEYQQLPRDECDLVHRMRLFERFHTPDEHKQFVADLLKAKRLRKEIAKLQMYRRMGIRTLVDAERYELDRARRHFHKHAHIQKDIEAKKAESAAAAAAAAEGVANGGESSSSYYWKQYRTADRKVRKSINRGDAAAVAAVAAQQQQPADPTSDNNKAKEPPAAAATDGTTDAVPMETDTADGASEKADGASPTAASAAAAAASNDAMDIDTPTEKVDKSNKTDEKPPATEEKAADAKPASKETTTDDISGSPGFKLLSTREAELCKSVQLQPNQYLEIKRALIAESLMQGLLDDKHKQQRNAGSGGGGSSSKSAKKYFQRSLVKIDVERRGAVIDFVVRAGWIPRAFGKSVRDGM